MTLNALKLHNNNGTEQQRPAPVRLIMEIESEAKKRVDHILKDVGAGKTTIRAEIKKRGGN